VSFSASPTYFRQWYKRIILIFIRCVLTNHSAIRSFNAAMKFMPPHYAIGEWILFMGRVYSSRMQPF